MLEYKLTNTTPSSKIISLAQSYVSGATILELKELTTHFECKSMVYIKIDCAYYIFYSSLAWISSPYGCYQIYPFKILS